MFCNVVYGYCFVKIVVVIVVYGYLFCKDCVWLLLCIGCVGYFEIMVLNKKYESK